MKKIYNFHSSRLLILIFELIIISSLYVFTSELFGYSISDNSNILKLLPFVIGVYFFSYLIFKTHITILRYTSYRDIFKIFTSTTLGFFILFILNNLFKSFLPEYSVNNVILIVTQLFVLIFIIGYRLAVRYLVIQGLQSTKTLPEKKVIIIGANYQSILTKHSLDYEKDIYHYKVIAYFTNNENIINKEIEGTRVNNLQNLQSYLKIQHVDVIFIVQNELSNKQLDQLERYCDQNDIDLVQSDKISNWTSRQINSNQQTDFELEELLNRDPINLSLDKISEELKGKKVLVTGAAGSIGSELCRQIVKFDPEVLIILDQAESPLFEIENELLTHFNPIISYIADITDEKRVEKIIANNKPNLIYHAAAYKHVPLMENNPSEAIKNNLIGSISLGLLASKYEVEKFIFISTDKAVNPTNVMGATKRAAEMYLQSFNLLDKNKTKFITTRFGNVLGSNGSVIPIFRKQIETGGPIKVTHPEITRYFMTIPEACQLVLEASTMGDGSEIFIFDMGKPVKILDLAKNLISKYGLKEKEDIDIEFIGLRPGEKLYEELLADSENTMPTHHDKILIGKNSFLDYDSIDQYYKEILTILDEEEEDEKKNMKLIRVLKTLIPEYVSNNSKYESLD